MSETPKPFMQLVKRVGSRLNWNHKLFGGFLEVIKRISPYDHLKLFSEYCQLREQGLRRTSFEKLNLFIEYALSLPFFEQKQIVDILLQAQYDHPDIHQLLPHNLFDIFIFPVLQAWREENTNSHVPIRWLGVYKNDSKLIEQAFAMDPSDHISRIELIKYYLGRVDDATDLIVESIFVGSEDSALEDLKTIKKLIQGIQQDITRKRYENAYRESELLVQDWLAYKKSSDSTFPEWCFENGKPYSWARAVENTEE